jgi:hypothetical protein
VVDLSSILAALQADGRFELKLTIRLVKPKTARKPRGSVLPVVMVEEANDFNESVRLLTSVGFTETDIEHYATEHSTARIRQCVQAIASSRKQVKSPAALLRRALDSGWYR